MPSGKLVERLQEYRAKPLNFFTMHSRQFTEKPIGFRGQAEQGASPIIGGNLAGDQPQNFEPVHQSGGAMRLQDKAVSYEADCGLLRAGTPYRQKALVLLWRQSNLRRLSFAECLKSADSMAKHGKGRIVGIFEFRVFVAQRDVSD